MASRADDSQSTGSQPDAQPPAKPTPSDEQIVQSLIGFETKDDKKVTDLVNRLVGGDEFTRSDD